jgi:L-rhamnose mutarotase
MFHKEYEIRHNPIPEELENLFKKHGVHTYSIYLHPETCQLFGYVEYESEELWNAISKTPECQRWWEFMKPLMEYNPDGSPKATNLKEVFHRE